MAPVVHASRLGGVTLRLVSTDDFIASEAYDEVEVGPILHDVDDVTRRKA